MAKSKLKIVAVIVDQKLDENPDTSYLCAYKHSPPSRGYYLDRKTGYLMDSKDGQVVADDLPSNYSRNEYKYLSGFQHYGKDGWGHVSDKDVCLAFLNCRLRMNRGHENRRGNLFKKHGVHGWENAETREQKIILLNIVYCCEDVCRMESLQRGDWCFLWIRTQAEVVSESGKTHTIRGGSIGGVESDSGKDYIKELQEECLVELRNELEAFGFTERQVTLAINKAEYKDG